MTKHEIGRLLEDAGSRILEEKGYKVLMRNYRAGRIGEIDIIALKDSCICFIEVKGRKNCSFGTPAEAVDFRKINKIRLLSKIYLSRNGLHGRNVRFDVLELYYELSGEAVNIKKHNIISNAF